MGVLKVILFFILGIIPVCSTHAYLAKGLDFNVVVIMDKLDKVEVFLELCSETSTDAFSCRSKVENISCTQSNLKSKDIKITQWNCSTKELLPLRIGIKKSGQTWMSSNSFKVFDRDTQDRFAIHVFNSKVDFVYAASDKYFFIGLQEMLENVFFPNDVELIRKQDKKMGRRYFESAVKQQTRLVYHVCQFEDCKKGVSEEISCNFSTTGVRGLAYECKNIPAAVRFAKLILFGRDKKRSSIQFRIPTTKEELFKLNFIFVKENELEIGEGRPPSTD